MASPLSNTPPIKKLLLAPVWFFQLFTTAKSFRDNPLLGSHHLNKLGLHAGRVMFAHYIMRFRMALLGFGVDATDRVAYQRDGFLAKENYIPAEQFARIEAEIRAFQGNARVTQQGDTQTRRVLLDPETLQQLPHTRQWLEDRNFRRLLRYTAGHSRLPFFNIEEISNGIYASNDHDPQKDLHTDTFHPTMKFWLYLDDVDEHNGPFTYIPTSAQLTRQRLHWEYQYSQTARHAPELYSARGSFRLHAPDLAQLGLPAPKAFRVKKNTLLIANTFGVHGRGQADPGSTRLSLWGMSRTNPFIPFPGFGLEVFNRLQYRILKVIKA